MYRNYLKRAIDFVLAMVAIICLSPLLIVVTIWLHFANKGAGVFFTQPPQYNAGYILQNVCKFVKIQGF